ncbi:MAG: DUF4215 domain-containing protein [Deltaproteobacteria bacterium]|nr:DUF4215 domain-containing protein [Deltaproteobacteria bacterium]
MQIPRPLQLAMWAAAVTSLLCTAAARAELHALGHEFRPTAQERTGTNPCTTSDGVTASLAFVCNEAYPGSGCANRALGKLFAEWRTAEGNLDSGPILIAEGYYSYQIPYSCSGDGAIMLVLDSNARVVDRQGLRGAASPVCTDESCFGPFGVSARTGGFLVVWPQYHRGLVGRFFDQGGAAISSTFLVDGPPSDAAHQQRGLLLPDGDVLLAWKTSDPPGVRAGIVGSDGSVVPAIQVSEFPYIDILSPLTLGLESADRVLIAWENEPEQAGWVARRVVTGHNVPTTTTSTTSTTLDSGTAFAAARELGTPAVGDDRYLTDAPGLFGDGSGHWFAAWLDHVPVGDAVELGEMCSSSSDDARHWSAPQPFHAEDYPAALASSVAADDGGVAIAAWARHDGAAVLFRRSSDGGHSWTQTGSIHVAEAPAEAQNPVFTIASIAVTAGTDSTWIAAWTEYIDDQRPCEENDDGCIDYTDVTLLCAILYSVSTDGGLTWSGAQTIAGGICWGGGDLQIAADGNGTWLSVWSDWRDGGVHGAYSSDNGEHWSSPKTLLSGIDLASSSLSIAGRDGHWLMAFSQWLFDWPTDPFANEYARVFVSHSADLSGDWSAPAGIAPWHDRVDGKDLYPSMAASEDGSFGLAWSTYSAGSGLDADIVAAFSSDSGQTWSRAHTVDTEANADARNDLSPRLVRAGAAWAVLWRTLEPSGHRTIRFARTRGNCGNGVVDSTEQCDDGNLVEGDGCDSTCLATGCGSQIVTGAEECDDGNTDDTDACISCDAAFCGDGFTWNDVEECDDANDIDTDACLDNCKRARCGDGELRPDAESCDDGDTSGNNDDCLNDCAIARCGDGYLHLGTDECDDGNLAGGDGCDGSCRLEADCGFFTKSGLRVTASDALLVLKTAVGLTSLCPMRSCDRDHDGSVTAVDALWTLRCAVGIFPDGCVLPSRLVLRMISSEKLGALQVNMSYIDAAGHVVAKRDGKPACQVLVSSVSSALNWIPDQGELRLGMISLGGFQGPLDLLTCQYDPVSGPSLHDFRVTVVDASGLDTNATEPPPTVTLTAE